jgi:hypothetical protein
MVKIVLQLTQSQREHVKMLTGIGPARLTIDTVTTGPTVLHAERMPSKLASKAIALTPEQREQIKSATGQKYEFLEITKANVEKWSRS